MSALDPVERDLEPLWVPLRLIASSAPPWGRRSVVSVVDRFRCRVVTPRGGLPSAEHFGRLPKSQSHERWRGHPRRIESTERGLRDESNERGRGRLLRIESICCSGRLPRNESICSGNGLPQSEPHERWR